MSVAPDRTSTLKSFDVSMGVSVKNVILTLLDTTEVA